MSLPFQIKIFFIACMLLGTLNCAVLHENNRFTTDLLEENLAPQSDSGKWWLAPVAIPVGFISMLFDAIIVQPLVSLPHAFYDARYVFTKIDYMGPFEIIAFPMRVISYPVYVVVDWIVRITIPIDWDK